MWQMSNPGHVDRVRVIADVDDGVGRLEAKRLSESVWEQQELVRVPDPLGDTSKVRRIASKDDGRSQHRRAHPARGQPLT